MSLLGRLHPTNRRHDGLMLVSNPYVRIGRVHLLGKRTFSGSIISSEARQFGVGALLQYSPVPPPSLVGQSAALLGIGLHTLLCAGLIDWSTTSFSEQGAPGRGLGPVEQPDLGEDIRTIVVVVVVSNGRTERKANVRGNADLNGYVLGTSCFLTSNTCLRNRRS